MLETRKEYGWKVVRTGRILLKEALERGGPLYRHLNWFTGDRFMDLHETQEQISWQKSLLPSGRQKVGCRCPGGFLFLWWSEGWERWDINSSVHCITPASLIYKTESQPGAFSCGFMLIPMISETLSRKHHLAIGCYLAIGKVAIYT